MGGNGIIECKRALIIASLLLVVSVNKVGDANAHRQIISIVKQFSMNKIHQ